jgi:hypothetical protein
MIIKKKAITQRLKYRRIRKLPGEDKCIRCRVNHGVPKENCINVVIGPGSWSLHDDCAIYANRHLPEKNYFYTYAEKKV